MGLMPFDSTQYQIEYIPQRLASLEVCVIACHSVLSNQVAATPLVLNLGSSVISQPDISLLIGVAIDCGLVANRTLMNFLGLKLSNGRLVNDRYALTVEKFGLPLTPTSDALKVLTPSIPELEMERIWVEALNTASKSIAHLTEVGATIRVARLGFACYATSLLIRRFFFQARSTPEPTSLLTAKVTPRIGGVWDAVDPTLNVLR